MVPERIPGRGRLLLDAHVADGGTALVVARAAELGIEQAAQAVDGTVERFLHRAGVVGDDDRLLTRDAGLEEAPLVRGAELPGVLVAEVDLEPGDPVGEPLDRGRELALEAVGDVVVDLDVAVLVELDLHRSVSFSVRRYGRRGSPGFRTAPAPIPPEHDDGRQPGSV
ncbi:hypothetical protein RHRU231_590076 [Rhodococcus ruber]|uniref:Uncharacterized protein n=1 Tax=Rhodococcus ruber TaxID=1830 RepID=A0A098BP41_9NOCA|nr:hypothetical protein RHRU231_590076 [Rhodococcus ruber]